MIDTSAYKKALDTGNRTKIIAEGAKMLSGTGLNALQPDAPNVNATKGADNSAEKARYEDQFKKQALFLTRSADAYNVASGVDIAAAATELQNRLQYLESSDANLREIERIDAGQGPGTGGGIPEVGTPAWAIKLQSDVTEIKSDVKDLKAR